ncbi:transporter substrate-binding domain-containing protein [Pseudodesulfovibrio sp.]|uniref:transporter substrate-binding domain-containing protein n=1 Tax=Pseudodesulfovibrio sp. TaxID=2035812 RepID=UPI0026192CD6|nr:transporter substrate-binding domain-containing protein [Pseudodesulfovibrio sp.]MDD3312712.1 transporter substrate-binding domain-containing protein [Pseudodesulfovibrio sp.]
MRTALALIPLVLLLCAAAPAQAEAPPTDDPWAAKPVCNFGMPYLGRAVLPRQAGMITAILQRVFEPEGVVLRHRAMPYHRAVAEVEQGDIQCTLSIGDAPPRLLRAAHPVFLYDLAAARLTATEWQGPASLADKRVAYLHGFDLAAILKVRLTPQLVYDLSSAFPLLEQGFVAYILGERGLLEAARRDSGLHSHLCVIEPIRTLPTYPVFAPTEAGRAFRDFYDRRMRALAASGDLAEILAQSGLSEGLARRLLQAQ